MAGNGTMPGLYSTERLEPRRLLADFTLITHGFEFGASADVSWMDTMANAIAQKEQGASIYTLSVSSSLSTSVSTRVSNSASGNVIVELNWTAAANYTSTHIATQSVAPVVLPYITGAGMFPGVSGPLAELPIHLIGHSRGASLVAYLAELLGQQGVEVDQLTTLDPHPLTSADPLNSPPVLDAPVVVYDNVAFADNYYETDYRVLIWPIQGQPVTGAVNTDLTSVDPSISHSAVHTYYYGTIARNATDDGDGGTINTAWYAGKRAMSGFDYSLIDGGDRSNVSAGLSSLAGGSATRTHVALTTSNPWTNIGSVSISGDSAGAIANGQGINLNYRYQDSDGGSSVSFYLDSDVNPYDGHSLSLGNDSNLPLTGATPNSLSRAIATTWNTSGLASGIYHLYAAINDVAGTRYSYMTQPLYVSSSGAEIVTRQWTGDVSGDWSNDSNWTPGGVPASTDRASIQLPVGGSITMAGSNAVEIELLSGTVNWSGGSPLSGAFDIAAGSLLNIAGNATVTSSGALNNGGTIKISSGTLTIAGSLNTAQGVLDLSNNELLVNAALSTIQNYLVTGHLVTSATGGVLGYRDLGGGQIEVRFTLLGDTDLDLTVNVADLANLAGNFGKTAGGTWVQGDLDYNGTVNVADLADLAGNFGNSLGGAASAQAVSAAFSSTNTIADRVGLFSAMFGIQPLAPLDPVEVEISALLAASASQGHTSQVLANRRSGC
jgi:hypothetical protein